MAARTEKALRHRCLVEPRPISTELLSVREADLLKVSKHSTRLQLHFLRKETGSG
ncbi:hypothetical protein J6590_072027 [Homalodisca vitripennis]|nr:hypothetical protein J6590_072027 [Homalodisca vitripennis]